MTSKLEREEKGFTIIEVVLVLAIAGLIFLIVFLALPQLQRSRRDTQRKADVGRVVSALESYAGNNNGNYPASQAETDTFRTNYLENGGSVFRDPQNDPNSNGRYELIWTAGSAAPTLNDTQDNMYYRTVAICGNAEGTFAAGSTRNVSVMIALENGIAYCEDNR